MHIMCLCMCIAQAQEAKGREAAESSTFCRVQNATPGMYVSVVPVHCDDVFDGPKLP